MKKHAIALLLIMLTGIAAGCINGGGHAPAQSSPAASTPTTPAPSHTTTSTPHTTVWENLLKWVNGVNQLTYKSTTNVTMNVTVETGGMTQNNTVALRIYESGYIDFTSKEAFIRTTTVSLPDNTTVSINETVAGGKTYISTGIGPVNVTNGSPELLWEYNIVGLAKKYLRGKPDEITNGSTTRLVYTLDWRDVQNLARMYLTAGPNTGIKVRGGNITFLVRDGRLVGGVLTYSVTAETVVTQQGLGSMKVTQNAEVRSYITITGINHPQKVKPPT